jgi:hypothetical protein
MSYTNVYPSRINWENEPSIASPINATNLNKIDYAVYEHDQTLETWDVTKANQSDLLLSVKSIDYDTTTGVFVFTWQNGTTKTVDLNIEKIPVSFSMSAQGVITMTTDDGTQYTADVGSLIKTYTFTDSTEIDFTVTTDQSGNKTVTAALKDGSIVGTKLEPNYLANCQSAANSASGSATAADGSAEDSEAWAVGTRDGVPVPSTDPAYNNNSKYWATQGGANSLAGLSDTDINSPTDGQGLVYNYSTSKWINGNVSSGSTITVFTNESSLYGRTVTLTIGQQTKTETFSNVGVAVFKGIVATGTFTITSSTSGGDTATATLDVPYFGNYTKQLTLFSATVTITYPRTEGATCTISDGVTTLTANASPMAFDIPNSGTWVATCTLDGLAQTESFTITTDGQTESHTFEYGTINLTFDNEFRGLTLTCTDSSYTITKTAPSTGNTMVFYPNETNTWTISGTYSGVTYTTTATVSSLSTPVSAILQTIPDGSTITPTDAIQTWLKCAGINDKNYTTLNEVLADTDTFTALLQDSNACDYMARSTTWASTICADADAMARIGKYDYCSCALLGNSTWASAIAGSSYVDSVLNASVPIMTSNTAPSGECFASDTYIPETYGAWKAFDKSNSTWWSSNYVVANSYIGYKFPSAVQVVRVMIHTYHENYATSVKLQGSNDGFVSDTHDIDTLTITTPDTDLYFAVSNSDKYLYYRLLTVTGSSGATNINYKEIQFYGHTAQTNIIHSAASDTLYYIDGTNQTIGTTDTSGVGTVNWSNVPVGNLTIYSSVAHDPDDLTSAYSKTVRITPHTVEVYVMPDNSLYWYGYKSNNMVNANSANGWTLSYSFGEVVYNTNNMYLKSNGNCQTGVTSDAAINGTKVKTIARASGAIQYTQLMVTRSKAPSDYENLTSISATSDALYECAIVSSNVYPLLISSITNNYLIASALWYE